MQYIQFVKKYLLGEIQYDEFIKNIDEKMMVYLNEKFEVAIETGRINTIRLNTFQKYLEWIKIINSSFNKKAELYDVIYKIINDINLPYYNKYKENCILAMITIPDYLDGDEACNYIEAEIFSKIPNNLSESKKKKFIKEECKKIFQYQTKKPRWVQSCEWPVVNGKPLKFMLQSEDGDLVQFHFIDEDTEKEYIVEQYC